MPSLMIVVGSVRPGRIGLPIARWVEQLAVEHGGFDIDFVDLAELDLPFMDEPNHPRLRQYTHQHTIDWSARVDAADAVIFVTPEYNHSFSPALKNALDYLSQEWWRKPVGFVSYGGVSAGTRGVTALEPVIMVLGMVRAGAAVELPFAARQLTGGEFVAEQKETAILGHLLTELEALSDALKPLYNRA
ncbi:NADPH-dependent FMN reductase [Lacisediminihabitans changchengi]|uniref:NAD(P)H-dependent oxidoreductase n=1 Tax=Lacisediminihabitans changchengi TaxID=2787634 RepID=A0A934VXP7_9MICO|nr:NAD(P)H-dependent oxidoreductase [Lacisediminihabitans changchengi]MBK4347162.1 NAD(P)H-dependent oxidoreductase [Lacisediminihabitans changchengi]